MTQQVNVDDVQREINAIHNALDMLNRTLSITAGREREIETSALLTEFTEVENAFRALSKRIRGETGGAPEQPEDEGEEDRPEDVKPTKAEERHGEERERDDLGVRTSFTNFFSSIGDSVLGVQRSLDESSRAYLEAAKGQMHILPTVFRIPKVSAEMKFALEKKDGKEVDLIFYKTTNEAALMHQQSVTFEIVAAPPPPEVLEKIRSLTPRLELILSPLTRSAIFEAISAQDTSASRSLNKEVLLSNKDRVLICPVEPDKRFLLFFADPSKEKLVGVWHVNLSQQPALEAVYLYERGPNQGENFKPFKEAIMALADKQATFLNQMS